VSEGRFARIAERAIRCRELSAADWRVLACIALHADATGRAYPGMTTIAEMTGVRRQDVPRTIRRLERFLQLRCEPGGGPNGANAYTLIFDDEVVSATVRTGVSATVRTVRNGADPQHCVRGVRNAATKVSATVRTKQTNKQTTNTDARSRARERNQETASQFDTFWRVYPHRGEYRDPKKPAREKFFAAVERGVDPELMIAAAENYANSIARNGTDGKYVTQAQFWLNQESWEQYGTPQEPEPLRAGLI
jgi:hypothetical protein